MLKDRFYYQDAYLKNFTAKIIHRGEDEKGRPYIVLDNTAFYPTGGGQPHDTGTIDEVHVLDVEEVDGEIRHFLEVAIPSEGFVEGVLNWERRFDHMQQHAGQHILTAAFVELFGFPTVSFHLGKGVVSIDLDVDNVSADQLEAVEKLANDIILENRPIETKWDPTEDELAQFSLRKQLTVTDEIRLVIIPGFDFNGCGGTHPSSTGQVGLIKILSTEKQKGQVRVHFVCGGRVLQQLQRKHEELSVASRLLSAPEDGVAVAIEKLLIANHSLEKSLEEAKGSLLEFESNALLTNRSGRIIKAAFSDRTVQELQKLARMLVTDDDSIIALLVAENEEKLQFVAARGAAVWTSMKEVSSAVLPLINGKGGGNDAFVQGGGERSMAGEEFLGKMVEFVGE
ncbi:alanyl-tRNA editing protein [Sporosarcina highlanderae]|uniref:DHHA1 domain-containing protein n=1 Tax=Sporosarcina highlanderae TaxID=3035916 RepID=A0ABT8JQ15_9BACL|nr:DHHA1 domain-containing protein [Sporosarcina highlanderae]MDN4606284.1 DHHA1 domain-containing protein [Sporosarcina highlanderae]